MNRKAWYVGALALAAGAAMAQSLTPSELEIDAAFKLIRPEPVALLRLIGSEYMGSTTTNLNSDLFWSRPFGSTSQDLQMELLEGRNSVWQRRIVADGRHVWGVDLVKNTYSTARYGSYTATKPADYESNALLSVGILSDGHSSWISRMAREVWGGTDALYRPWIPASSNRSEYTVQGGASIKDPVVQTRTYVSSTTKKFHIYWLQKAGTPVRSVTFELDENQVSNAWHLKAVYFSDRVKIGTVDRLTDWKTEVFSGVLPSSGNFAFVPGPGARAIAGPRPNGSG